MKRFLLHVVLAIAATLSLPALADIDHHTPPGAVAFLSSDTATAVAAIDAAVMLSTSIAVWPDGSGMQMRSMATNDYTSDVNGVGSGTSNDLAAAIQSFEVGWLS